MRGQSTAYLRSGIQADFRAARTRVALGASIAMQLHLVGADGEPLREPLAGAGLVVSIPGQPPADTMLTPDPTAPGVYNSTVQPNLKQRGEVTAVVTVRDTPPGRPMGDPIALVVSADYGVDAVLEGRPIGRLSPSGPAVEVLARTYRRCRLAIVGERENAWKGGSEGSRSGA